uniref:Uncharacterized protein n=1 Tax=Romanomermis culicivorax TaxID=13658 RepID=A0A915J821_ROMCU
MPQLNATKNPKLSKYYERVQLIVCNIDVTDLKKINGLLSTEWDVYETMGITLKDENFLNYQIGGVVPPFMFMNTGPFKVDF